MTVKKVFKRGDRVLSRIYGMGTIAYQGEPFSIVDFDGIGEKIVYTANLKPQLFKKDDCDTQFKVGDWVRLLSSWNHDVYGYGTVVNVGFGCGGSVVRVRHDSHCPTVLEWEASDLRHVRRPQAKVEPRFSDGRSSCLDAVVGVGISAPPAPGLYVARECRHCGRYGCMCPRD